LAFPTHSQGQLSALKGEPPWPVGAFAMLVVGAVLTASHMSCIAVLSRLLSRGVEMGLAVCVPVHNPVCQGLLLKFVGMQSKPVCTSGVGRWLVF